MTELKSCHRCGGKPTRVPRFCMGYAGDGVKCECGAETPSHLYGKEAESWWNTRADGWISVDERLPHSQDGRWSREVIALSDTGDVFKLMCMGDYWQRSSAFIESESTKITHWMPLPAQPKA